MPSLSVFDYIREINLLPTNILTPAKFKILVEIAMRINETSSTWPKNKELSDNTAIKPDSVKVILSQLKKDNFINIEKQDGKRMIYLCHPTEKKRLMVINENGKKLMVINQKVNGHLPPYIKEKEKKNLKEKMLPQGIFLEKHGDKIPKGIDGQFRQSQLDSYHLKYGDVFLKICHDSASVPIHQRAKYVQGAVNILINKTKMQNEQDNINQNEQYKEDLIFIANEIGPLLTTIGGQI